MPVKVRILKAVPPAYLAGVNPHLNLTSRSQTYTLYVRKLVDDKKVLMSAEERYQAVLALGRACRTSKFDEFELESTLGLKDCLAFAQGFYDPNFAKRDGKSFKVHPSVAEEFEKYNKHLYFMRDLVNEGPDTLYPEKLAEKAVAHLEATAASLNLKKALSVKVTKFDELLDKGYVGLHTVGKGSEKKPCLVEVDFNPTGKKNAPVFAALVGKGITFDTGGYSLKPSQSMLTMRGDMGGAALMTATLAMAMQLGLNRRVKLFLSCAENMVSSTAYRLGDIIKYPNGVSVCVDNTDAEGRLVLADSLILANQANHGKRPELVIDAATLTGSAKAAVGTDYHSLLSMDDKLAQDVEKLGKKYFERFWRLPFAEFHRDQIKSPVADISNTGSVVQSAGASTAAAFLSYFVEDYQKGWLHIDASATFNQRGGSLAYGATGIGVRTLAQFLVSKNSK